MGHAARCNPSSPHFHKPMGMPWYEWNHIVEHNKPNTTVVVEQGGEVQTVRTPSRNNSFWLTLMALLGWLSNGFKK